MVTGQLAANLRPARNPNNGQLLPGQVSLNPTGRPRGVPAMIDAMGNINDVIAFLFDVAVGKLSSVSRVNDRLVAAKELLDRRFGRAPTTIEITPSDAAPRAVSVAETLQLVMLRDEMEAQLRAIEQAADAERDDETGDGVAAIDVKP